MPKFTIPLETNQDVFGLSETILGLARYTGAYVTMRLEMVIETDNAHLASVLQALGAPQLAELEESLQAVMR